MGGCTMSAAAALMHDAHVCTFLAVRSKQAARELSGQAIRDGFEPEALHTYTDELGKPACWKVRLRDADGRKWIRPMRRDGARFELGEPEYVNGKPLYNLHLIAAAPPEQPVFVVEGEWCADHLTRLGVLATTSGSADSAERADWTPLTGRSVTVWPDNDQAGARYGETVCARLRASGLEVRMLDVSVLGLPPKGDAIEWMEIHPDATASDVLGLPLLAEIAKVAGAAAIGDWLQPEELPSDLLPVPAFPEELLPDSLRPWVCDIAHRVQCAPEFLAVPAIVALGSLIGRRIGIRPQAHTDWTETPNLWGCIVGRPGCMKSPALSAALAPMERLTARARKDYEEQCRRLTGKRIEAELRAAAAKEKAKRAYKKGEAADLTALSGATDIEEPVERRYLSHDPTHQALAEILRGNPNGLLVVRDELVSLLAMLDAESNAEARGFYLTGWNGNAGYTVDRIGRGLNLHVPAVCISMIGGTQPARLTEYVRAANRGGARDDGLIQRFGMLVWPDQSADWRNVDTFPDSTAKKIAFSVFDSIDSLDPRKIGAVQDLAFNGEPEGTPYLRFAPDALEAFTEWRTNLEREIRGNEMSPALESHFSKYRKLVPAIALISHLADGGIGPVSLRATLIAIAWAEYLMPHAQRAYRIGSAGASRAARLVLARLRSGALPSPFAAREIYRRGWAGLSEPELVAEALSILEDYGYIRSSTEPTSGRPLKRFQVNPLWLE
jgi:hypothetical protein